MKQPVGILVFVGLPAVLAITPALAHKPANLRAYYGTAGDAIGARDPQARRPAPTRTAQSDEKRLTLAVKGTARPVRGVGMRAKIGDFDGAIAEDVAFELTGTGKPKLALKGTCISVGKPLSPRPPSPRPGALLACELLGPSDTLMVRGECYSTSRLTDRNPTTRCTGKLIAAYGRFEGMTGRISWIERGRQRTGTASFARIAVSQGAGSAALSRIQKVVAPLLGIERDTLTANASIIRDLGMDSLDCVEVVMALEEEFKIEISDEAAVKFHTLGDMARYVESRGQR